MKMAAKMIFLLAGLLSITNLSFEASVKGQMKKLDLLIKDLENEVAELAHLNDESLKPLKRRIYRDSSDPKSFMEVNYNEHTDDVVKKYCEIHGCVVQEGDELISPEQKKIQEEDNKIAKNNELTKSHDPIRNPILHWKKMKTESNRYVVPYSFSSVIRSENETVNLILEAMERFKEKSCIDWVPVEEVGGGYHVEFIKGGGCYSYVGDARDFFQDKQPISIGYGCEYIGTILHEMLHCLGFYHEQSRPDRDNYVELFLKNLVNQTYASQFEKQSAAAIDSHGIDYDINSVMHYRPDAFAKPNTYTILKRVPGKKSVVFSPKDDGLTDSDLKQLNSMYQCEDITESTEAPVTEAPELQKECEMMAILGLCKYQKICSICRAQCAELPTSVLGVVNINIQQTSKCKSWVEAGYCEVGHQYFTYMHAYCLKECLNKTHPADGGCDVANAF